MSGTLAPTNEQYAVTFTGIEKEENLVKPTKAILKKEYLAGGYVGSEDTYLILSHRKDYTSTLTDARIRAMLKDPEIDKCIRVTKNGVLGDGVTIDTPFPEPIMLPELDVTAGGEDYRNERLARAKAIERWKLAKKYADFATRAIVDNLDSIREVLDDLLGALVYGNRVAEKVYEEVYDPEFGKKLYYLKYLKVKPRSSTVFVVDRFFNLVGFKTWVKVKDENGAEKYVPKIIDKSKFVVVTFGMENGDPRGRSILESVEQAWHLKQELWPEYLRWLIYSSIPPIVGYTSDKAESRKVLRDAETGELIKDADGNVVYESDVGALLQALSQVRNATAIALPHGAKVEAINGTVSGDPFKGFRDVLNEEIEMALLLQTLATSDSRYNTRAASQVHVSILDEAIWRIKGLLVDVLTKQVLRPLMELNFEDFDISLMPIISLGDVSRRDFAGDVTGVSALANSEYIGYSQLSGIDRILGLPPRDLQLDLAVEKLKAVNKSLAKAPAPNQENGENEE